MADLVDAPAKLTLSLRITGVRSDGYHLIDAEMVELDVADRLEFSPGNGLEILYPPGASQPAGAARVEPVPTGGDNLVRRALDAVGRKAHVRLVKRIPAGAGLGGGSADAAAVLRWAGVDDPGLAATLGADVPFCVVGGRARVTGIGEVVEPLPLDEVTGASYTLLTPPLHVSTLEVYRQWDRMGGPSGDNGNDLEPAALAVRPELAGWRDALGDATGQTPKLAGSGGTWFVLGGYPEAGLVVGVGRRSA